MTGVMRRLADWYWNKLWDSVVRPYAHILYPDKVAPQRLRDDLLLWLLFIPVGIPTIWAKHFRNI